jgi:hypothetical protein
MRLRMRNWIASAGLPVLGLSLRDALRRGEADRTTPGAPGFTCSPRRAANLPHAGRA